MKHLKKISTTILIFHLLFLYPAIFAQFSELERNIEYLLGIDAPIFKNVDEDGSSNTHFGIRPSGTGGYQPHRAPHIRDRIEQFQKNRKQKIHDWYQLKIHHHEDSCNEINFQKNIKKIEDVLTTICQKSTSKEIIEAQVLGLQDLVTTILEIPSLDEPLQLTVNRILNQLYDKNGGFIGINDDIVLDKVCYIVSNYLKYESYNALTLDVADALGIKVDHEEKEWFHSRLHSYVDSGLPFQQALLIDRGHESFVPEKMRFLRLMKDRFSYNSDINKKIQDNNYTQCLIAIFNAQDARTVQHIFDEYVCYRGPHAFTSSSKRELVQQRLNFLEDLVKNRRKELERLALPQRYKNSTLQAYISEELERFGISTDAKGLPDVSNILAQRCKAYKLSPQAIANTSYFFSIDPNRFRESNSTKCNEARYDLVRMLEELAKNNLKAEDKSIASNLADVTLKCIESDQPHIAQTFTNGLCAAAEFLMGATGEYIKIRALQAATTYAVEYAASTALFACTGASITALSPWIIPAMTIGYAAYQIGSNVKQMIDMADKAPKLWQEGNYRDLGTLSADALVTLNAFNSMYKLYKNNSATLIFTENVEVGKKVAKQTEFDRMHQLLSRANPRCSDFINEVALANPNKRHHILVEKHDWGKVVNDPKNWDEVAPLILKTMREGVQGTHKRDGLKKSLQIGKEVIDVTYAIHEEIIKISNAWVRKCQTK